MYIYECDIGTYTIGYWKNHPEAWPVDTIEIGGITYTKAAVLDLLWNAKAKYATKMLAAQLIAAILNVESGASPPGTTIDDANAFLSIHPIGVKLSKADRAEALSLKDILDSYNNGF